MRIYARVVLASLLAMALVGSQTAALAGHQSKGEWTPEDQKEVAAYLLTMEKVKSIASAMKELKAWREKNPGLAKDLESDESGGSLSASAKAIDAKFPQAAAIIKKNGIDTREFLVGLYVLFASFGVVSMKKSGDIKDYSSVNKTVNPANLQFVESHFDEIEELMPAEQ